MNKTENILNQFGKNAQQVSLTKAEKDLHRQKLQQFMSEYSAHKAAKASPLAHLLDSLHQLFRRPALIAAPLAVILGTGVVLASQSALPGTLLYPIKTNVVEKIQSTLATTHEQKAELNKDLAIRRLDEAETLLQKNQLTPEISKQLTTHFEEKGKEMEKELEELQKNQKDQVVQQVRQEYSDSLKNHQETLRSLQKNQYRDSRNQENESVSENRDTTENSERVNTAGQIENSQSTPVITSRETELRKDAAVTRTDSVAQPSSDTVSTTENNIKD